MFPFWLSYIRTIVPFHVLGCEHALVSLNMGSWDGQFAIESETHSLNIYHFGEFRDQFWGGNIFGPLCHDEADPPHPLGFWHFRTKVPLN